MEERRRHLPSIAATGRSSEGSQRSSWIAAAAPDGAAAATVANRALRGVLRGVLKEGAQRVLARWRRVAVTVAPRSTHDEKISMTAHLHEPIAQTRITAAKPCHSWSTQLHIGTISKRHGSTVHARPSWRSKQRRHDHSFSTEVAFAGNPARSHTTTRNHAPESVTISLLEHRYETKAVEEVVDGEDERLRSGSIDCAIKCHHRPIMTISEHGPSLNRRLWQSP